MGCSPLNDDGRWQERLPGLNSLMRAAGELSRPVVDAARTHRMRGVAHANIALEDLSSAAGEVSDMLEASRVPEGAVLRLYEIDHAGIVHTVVRETSDGNMAGGSHHAVAIPARASSRVVRSFLTSLLLRGPVCARLGTIHDHRRAVEFEELSSFSRDPEFDGLSICMCCR